MCSRSSNVSVLIKEGVFFYWKKSAFSLLIRGLFWPEISALGVFLNFNNERMSCEYWKVIFHDSY